MRLVAQEQQAKAFTITRESVRNTIYVIMFYVVSSGFIGFVESL